MTPDEVLAEPATVLSQAQRQSYFDDGYLLIEEALPPARLQELRRVAEALRARGDAPEDCPADFEFETIDDGHRPIRQVLCAADHHPGVWAYASGPPLTDIIADLVGPDVKFRESGVSFKRPGGRGFDWHQDIVFFPSSNLTPVMTLTFLEDIDEQMGPTQVIPGSHTGEIYDHYDASGNWQGLIGEHEKPKLPVERATQITGPAGSILITNCAIVHCAAPNRSQRHRPMVLAGYSNADTVSYTDIPYRSKYRWQIVRGAATQYVHSQEFRMKTSPDWSAYDGVRIDNLYAKQ